MARCQLRPANDQSDRRDRRLTHMGCSRKPDGHQKNAELRVGLSLSAMPSAGLRKNHTLATGRLTGSILDAGSADHRESASADLRRSELAEA